MIVKPSPETPLSVLTLGYLALQAGFPPGVFNVLTTSLDNTPSLSEALCRHELVKKVTFTGSTRVGKLISKICADGLKKVTLELGGNCPFLVFEDADLEQASNGISSTKLSYSYMSGITDSISRSAHGTQMAPRRSSLHHRQPRLRPKINLRQIRHHHARQDEIPHHGPRQRFKNHPRPRNHRPRSQQGRIPSRRRPLSWRKIAARKW